MSLTARAVWYVESHLDDDVTLDAVAQAAGVTRFHLCRAFTATTGMPLAAYARARRLSVAAQALLDGAPDILTVALAAGYGSHEAFTRAFRQHFGRTPEQFRALGREAATQLQEPFPMNSPTTAALSAPRMASRESLLVFGLSQRCKAVGHPDIPGQWNRFTPCIDRIEGQVGRVAYGVIYNSDGKGLYDYLCGVEVREAPAEPSEFVSLRIPTQNYAVFEHAEHVSAIGGTWRAIWEHGLSDAGCEAADGPAFERYDERFDAATGRGGFEIWVPVNLRR